MARPIKTRKQARAERDTRSRAAKFVDRRIESLFPSWGIRRAESRVRLRAFAAYDAATTSRLIKVRTGTGGTADRHMSSATLWTLREKARAQDRNNSLVHGILQTWVDNVIGNGHQPQARTQDAGWNEAAEAWFREWAETRADIRGVMSFWEMQRIALRSLGRDGDIGFILSDGQLQAIEADRIGTNRGDGASDERVSQPRIVNGVELNQVGKPVNYWVGNTHPNGSYVSDAKPVPARDFIHLYRPTRFSATRGVPVLAPVLNELDRLEDYIESVVIASQMAAMFGLIVKTSSGYETARGTEETNPRSDASEQVEELEPGSIMYLPETEGVEQVKPEQPSQAFDKLVDTLARFCGRNLGLPLELILLNFSHSNFSNTRAAMQQAYRTFEGWQTWLDYHFLRRVWRYAISHAMKHGELPPNDDAFHHEWNAPKWPWIDPLKDVKASILAVQHNFTTRRAVVVKMGAGDADEILDVNAKDYKARETAGLPEPQPAPTSERGQ